MLKLWPLLILLSLPAFAEIEDNSFLLLEAYTQGKNEIQFIQHYNSPQDGDYRYDLTLEMPLEPDKQQLNTNLTSGEEGDFNLGYTYQLSSSSIQNLTLTTPTDGSRSYGATLLHAITHKLSENWVNHWNLGLEFRTDTTLILGTSLVYLLHDRLNLLTEVLLETDKETSLILNPGLRSSFKLNWKNTEMVPGLAFPIEIKKDPVNVGVFLYLSFESEFI